MIPRGKTIIDRANPAEKLRYFRGIAQLVARFVRDEEAVGSNPAAPTKIARRSVEDLRAFFFFRKLLRIFRLKAQGRMHGAAPAQ